MLEVLKTFAERLISNVAHWFFFLYFLQKDQNVIEARCNAKQSDP